MKALVQRVSRASVTVEGERVCSIGAGLLVLLGVQVGDEEGNAIRLAAKVASLRIFEDEQGRMNEDLQGREVLCVSQFTLCADVRKGNRPSFTGAAPPEIAQPLYQRFCEELHARQGVFGAHMQVELLNDGPVTLMLEA